MADGRAPGAMTFLGEVAIADTRDAIDGRQVGELLRGMGEGLFQVAALADGGNQGASQASPRVR